MSTLQPLQSVETRAVIRERDELIRDRDMAWAAGLFEGEGCATSSVAACGRRRFILALASTDKDVLEHFRDVVGVGNILERKRQKPHHKQSWLWKCHGHDARELATNEAFFSLLGERRSTRIREILGLLDAQPPPYGPRGTHCPRGHPYDEENTYVSKRGSRQCRACHREESRRRWRRLHP